MEAATSLVAFTLLAQAGIGLVLAALWAGAPAPATAAAFRLALPLAALGLGLAFTHLGRPFRAHRALANLGRSWLSRECLALAVFLALAGIRAGCGGPALAWTAGAAGALALVSMASIYGHTAFPAWGRGQVQATFWTAALALGGLALAALAPGAPGQRALVLAAAATAGQTVASALPRVRPGAVPVPARARRPQAAGLVVSALGGLGYPVLALGWPARATGPALALAGLLLVLGQVLVRHAFFASAVHPMATAWADLPPAEGLEGRP